MDNFIIVGKNGRPSMRAVHSQLACTDLIIRKKFRRSGRERWYKNGVNLGATCLPENAFCIRWGTRYALPNENKVINKASALKNASNKALCRHILQDNNIAVPKTWFKGSMSGIVFPIIARPETHRAGKQFYVCNNRSELNAVLNKTSYYQEIYPKTNEYRVHVAHGKVLAIMEKPLNEHDLRANRSVNGDTWRTLPWGEYDYTMCKLACKAVKTVGLDFGAVDVMAQSTNSNYPKCVVAEINTAPTLRPYLQQRYAEYFKWLFDSNGEVDHFDFEEFEDGRHFAFKHRELRVGDEEC